MYSVEAHKWVPALQRGIHRVENTLFAFLLHHAGHLCAAIQTPSFPMPLYASSHSETFLLLLFRASKFFSIRYAHIALA